MEQKNKLGKKYLFVSIIISLYLIFICIIGEPTEIINWSESGSTATGIKKALGILMTVPVFIGYFSYVLINYKKIDCLKSLNWPLTIFNLYCLGYVCLIVIFGGTVIWTVLFTGWILLAGVPVSFIRGFMSGKNDCIESDFKNEEENQKQLQELLEVIDKEKNEKDEANEQNIRIQEDKGLGRKYLLISITTCIYWILNLIVATTIDVLEFAENGELIRGAKWWIYILLTIPVFIGYLWYVLKHYKKIECLRKFNWPLTIFNVYCFGNIALINSLRTSNAMGTNFFNSISNSRNTCKFYKWIK